MRCKILIVLMVLSSLAFSSGCRSKSGDTSKKIENPNLAGQWKLTEKAANGSVWTQVLYLSQARNFVQVFMAKDGQSDLGELMAEAEIDVLFAGAPSKDLQVKANRVIFDQYHVNALPIIGYDEDRWSIVQADESRMILQVANKQPSLVYASVFGMSCSSKQGCEAQVEYTAVGSRDIGPNFRPDGFDLDLNVPVSPEHYYCQASDGIDPEMRSQAKNGQWLTFSDEGTTYKCRFVNEAYIPSVD